MLHPAAVIKSQSCETLIEGHRYSRLLMYHSGAEDWEGKLVKKSRHQRGKDSGKDLRGAEVGSD